MERIKYKTDGFNCITQCPYVEDVFIGSSQCDSCVHCDFMPTSDFFVECTYKDDIAKQPDTPKQIGGTHYEKMKIQPIEFIEANNLGFHVGNAIKYICRYESKNGIQDIDKAIDYLNRLKRKIENESKLSK